MDRAEVVFSLRTADKAEAKRRKGAALAHLEGTYEALRAGPQRLSHRQVIALSGEVYRLLVDKFDENPGDPAAWAAWKAFNRAIREGRTTAAQSVSPSALNTKALEAHRGAAEAAFGGDLTHGVNSIPKGSHDSLRGLEERFGALTAWVLSSHGIVADEESRRALLLQVERAATDAGWRLKRAAGGDYSPDPNEARFPPLEVSPSTVERTKTPAPTAKGGTPIRSLFEGWAKERKPAASTLTTWRGYVSKFETQFGKRRDVGSIHPREIAEWKDKLASSGLSPKTVNDGYLSAIRTLIEWGKSNHLVGTNPAEGISVRTARGPASERLPYTTEEVFRLLRLASTEEAPLRRWIPHLCAYTGARVGEIAQLWGSRVRQEGETWVIDIRAAEDGGSLKNAGSSRTVPLHPVLVEMGFPAFAKGKGERPIFYGGATRATRARRKGTTEDATSKPGKRHASKGVTNRVGEWIRAQGFTDPRKDPSHALRHWTKTQLQAAGVSDSIADAIQGHSGKSVADRYRHAGIETMLAALKKLPVDKSP